ncbi:predicted protein [Pyrenophora tritici-repentis Pt-1C-BFP]|uniref:LysM domain containing protein n=2 Tax=Pyrenophora tritici-repentis TaxID=45151 RepID=A0A922NDR1_9PLEO|nr:uncharacterized protein PTRG_05421 [Pyrenophora tritici-repentis Pt-1C-BFP]EDU48341.1 predicted protein [Pyrenophora tritici-repentis Pt-1C-BFP]KAI1514071.1 LysM domain containing protein [Pyrenophora tritici-repentis]KAI1682472.1 LysM domain containing protein [Pyrenophora tritici-repentis]
MAVFNMQTLVSLIGVVSLASAYRVPPPTITAKDAHQDCDAWHIAKTGESFGSIANFYRLNMAQFKSYNPAVCVDTDTLVMGASYCINYTPSLPTPTTALECNSLHFVEAYDTCFGISTMNNLTLAQFYAMNPALDNRCKNLSSNQYVCVSSAVKTPERTEVEVPAGHAHYICVAN